MANSDDSSGMTVMPPYSQDLPPFRDIILVAINQENMLLGAISVGKKCISYIPNYVEYNSETILDSQIHETTGYWISKLYVLPKYRKQGIGSKLVEEAIRYLSLNDPMDIFVGIYDNNECRNVSRKIFKKHGFSDIGSCICFLSKGYCKGSLMKHIIQEQVLLPQLSNG